MDKYINEYIEYLKSEGVSYEKTISHYVYNIKECLTTMNINDIEGLENLTWIDLRMYWLNPLKNEGLSGSALNLRITSMKSFLSFMEGKKLITTNVCKDLKKYKTNKRTTEIDLDKLQKMIDIVNNNFNKKPCYRSARDRMIVLTLLFTGIRNQECRDIMIDDINFSSGEFTTTGKFGKSRDLCIPKQLMPIYRNYLMYRNQLLTDDPHLFVSKSGLPLDKNMINRLIKKLAKEVGFDDTFVCHSCRHCFTSISLASGSSLEDVSKTLGHSSVMVTSSIYAEQQKELNKQVINNNILLNKIIG